MGETSTPLYRLADLLLADDGGLRAWVTQHRTAGLSWRKVEKALYDATGGEVDVTYQTLREWFPELVEAS